MRVRGFHFAVAAVMTLLVFISPSIAESAPWFDDLLIEFPNSLLLEAKPVARLPVVMAHESVSNDAPGVAHVSSDDVQSSAGDVSLGDELEPTAFVSAASRISSPRRLTRVSPARRPCTGCERWQKLPDGILYPSYLAGEKEPRMAATILNEKDRGTILEATIGGRLGLLRHGTVGPINPQGWQWDLEAAALLRQDIQEKLDVEATDFRFGTVITWKRGHTAVKGGYYHLSSHLGDEFIERNPAFQRLNYVRDSLIFGVYHFVTDNIAVYGEVAYAFRTDGGAEPFEFQFGTEYSSPRATCPRGGPFAAVNAHLREEFGFGGGFNALVGWEWRGETSNHRFRVGAQYYTGKEIQWSFFDEDITLVGAGIWYDF